MSAHQYDHGHTVAGWVGTGIGSVGAAVAGVGVCFVSGVLIAGGLGIGVVGLLVTWALHLAGWGHDKCLACRLAGRRRVAGSGRTAEVAGGVSVRGEVSVGGEAEAAAVGADAGR